MKRWKSLLAVAAIAGILVGARSSIAYFTAKDQTDNVFTVGTVDITLDEPAWDETADHSISPGAVYDKDPTVHNTGDTDAYVRIRVLVTDYAAFRAADPAYDPAAMFTGLDEAWERTGEAKVDTEADTVEYTYTLKEFLPAGADSQPLFKSVTMPPFADTDFTSAAGGSFDVTICADAIQADGFADHTEAFAAFNEQAGQ